MYTSRKELRQAAKNSILSGNSKEETFESLRGQSTESDDDLAKYIQSVPTLEQRENYRALYIILICLVAIVAVLKTIFAFMIMAESGGGLALILLIVPVIQFALLWGLIKYVPGLPSMIAIFGILGILRTLRTLGDGNAYVALDILLALALIVLGFVLNRQLFPKLEIDPDYVTDENGQTQTKKIYRFTEY